MRGDGGQYDRRAETDYRGEYGADRCGDAESGHRKEDWSLRNGGGLSFVERKPKDGTISGDRTGVPGSQYAEAPAEVQWLDGADHTARMRSSGRNHHLICERKRLDDKSEVVDVIDFSLHEICVRQEYGNYKKC